MYHVKIIGTGSYLPKRTLTNQDLSAMVDTNDQWIVARTGIRERRIAENGETNVTMGKIALERAVESAGIGPEEIESLVVGTNTTNPVWPSASGHIAGLTGLRRNICFFDVQAGCTGFNYAFSIAESMVKAGQYRTVAVIGTDKLSAITDYEDRNTCVLFGDGAGAVILQRSDEEGLIRSHLGGDAMARDLLLLVRKNGNGSGYIRMEGKKIYVFAKKVIIESCLRVLDPSGTAGKEEIAALLSRVAKIIPHQANLRIIHAAADDLESYLSLPSGEVKDKMVVTIDRYGNNSCASIPIALDEACARSEIRRGDLFIMVGFGAGLTYGANLVRY